MPNMWLNLRVFLPFRKLQLFVNAVESSSFGNGEERRVLELDSS